MCVPSMLWGVRKLDHLFIFNCQLFISQFNVVWVFFFRMIASSFSTFILILFFYWLAQFSYFCCGFRIFNFENDCQLIVVRITKCISDSDISLHHLLAAMVAVVYHRNVPM